MANEPHPIVSRWYTFVEYYNEEGIQIAKRDAIKNYIVRNTIKKIEINGTIGKRIYWKQCERNKQLRLF